MSFLCALENIRSPFLDEFFSVITYLGSETLFMIAAVIVFWCISKKNGYYILTVGFFGTIASQLLKLVCAVPRPWVSDSSFTIVEAARAEATGYSFPSGHTQNAVSVFGTAACFSRKKWVKAVCAALIALIAFSRMYLGVHYPADVAAALVIGFVFVFALLPVFKKQDEHPAAVYAVMIFLVVLSAAYVIFAETYTWSADIDKENLAEGIKNGYTVLGSSVGMLVSYFLDRKYIHFDVNAKLVSQIAKVVLGFAGIMAIKVCLKTPLLKLFGGHDAANAVRYLMIFLFAATVWPLTFKWFAAGCPVSKKGRKAIIVVIIVLLVIALLAAFLFWIVTKDSNDIPIESDGATNPFITSLGTTMLSAHRAGGGIAPENTLMAFENCIQSEDYTVDVFEFDLHMTLDGELVLLHDSTLDRTSNAAEYFGEENVDVGTKKFEELKKLNMGEKFTTDGGSTPYAGLRGNDIPDNLRIMSLSETLEYLEGNGRFRYIIEIKDSGEKGYKAADRLYETLRANGCLGRAIIGTFHNEVTSYIDENYPNMYRSAGVNECIKFYFCSLLGLKVSEGTFRFVALQIPTTDYVINLGTSRVVNYAHTNNIAVQYWTINDTAEMERLQSIGADAIMTDTPDAASAVLRQP